MTTRISHDGTESAAAIAPPYSADTRARGWRFEIDHEQIMQSDTWAIAKPEIRPWLLMLWMIAWTQTPCGSLPAADAIIAAKIGMPPKLFARQRSALMRGWWLANDGRYYHPTITQRVRTMLDARDRDRARTARSRASRAVTQPESGSVTRDTSVTPTGLRSKSQVSSPPVPVPVPVEEQDQELSVELPLNLTESAGADSARASTSPKADPIPYQAIADAYNRELTRLPKVQTLTPKRKTLMRTAWQADPRFRSLGFWADYFAACEADDFLNGTGPYGNGHANWRPTLDYLLRHQVVIALVERVSTSEATHTSTRTIPTAQPARVEPAQYCDVSEAFQHGVAA